MVLLIADDETFIRKGLLSLDWQKLGFEQIFEAAHGIEAKALIEEHHIDIVICDIRMPGLNGLEIAEYIYQSNMNIKVIILTGFSDFEYAKAAIHHQVYEYLLKPVDPDELFGVVKAAANKLNIEKYEKEIVNEYEKKVKKFSASEHIMHGFRSVDSQALEIIQYIADNYEKNITLQQLSKIYHLSPVYLSRYIKKETGYSFMDILICIRLLMAIELLRDDKYKISMISDIVGFKDQRYFSQIFKKILNYTPNEFRKMIGGKKNYTIKELLERKNENFKK